VSRRIVVVSPDGERLSTLVDGLLDAGYRATGASTFAEGKRLVAKESPDLVIADERLGPFNGLHLIVVGRAHRPAMKGIITSHKQDPALEHVATGLDVGCLVDSTELSGWLSSISTALDHGTNVIH
jgi:DNA-binding response OmpR family regulator